MVNSLVGEAVPSVYVETDGPPVSQLQGAGDMGPRNEGAVPDGTEIYVALILVASFLVLVAARRGGFRSLVAV